MQTILSHSLSVFGSFAVLLVAMFVLSRMPLAPAVTIMIIALAFALRRLLRIWFMRNRLARRGRSARRIHRRAIRVRNQPTGSDRQLRTGDDLLRFSVFDTGGHSRIGLIMVEPGSAVSGVRIRTLSFWVVLRVHVHGIWRGDVFLDAAEGVTVQPGDLVSVSGTDVRLDALASFFQQSPANSAHIDE